MTKRSAVGMTTAIALTVGLAAMLSERINASAQIIEELPATARSGDVRAVFDAQHDRDRYCMENAQIQISRQGDTLFDDVLPQQILEDTGFCRPLALDVLALNQDAEPEILLDVYSGGAHCCTSSLIYSYVPERESYTVLNHFWGNAGYQLSDLDADGVPEFATRDDSFAYAFAAYAVSRYPIAIWRYDGQSMENVTREFPDLIYSDAYRHWQEFERLRNGEIFDEPYTDDTAYIYQEYEQAILAAYLADKYLLGQEADGWQRVRAVYRRGDRDQFFAELSSFLSETGYTDLP